MTMRASLCAVIGLLGASAGFAQTDCGEVIHDVITGAITGVANWGVEDGVAAYSLSTQSCNIGTAPLQWEAMTDQHPLFGQNLFRLKTVDGAARFEHIGQSWVFHEYFALSIALCCPTCEPTSGDRLGVGCSTTSSASVVGQAARLGPKWQVNAATGAFPQPPADPPHSGPLSRRLQAHLSDIDPANNPGAQYFVEIQFVTPDESGPPRDNNASYRPCHFVSAGNWPLSLTGAVEREQAAIRAWKAADPQVIERDLAIPGDGLFILAARATPIAGGMWRYEYAIHNFNSDRSARALQIPIPDGALIENAGFHDVDYHSGDGMGDVNISGVDWAFAELAGAVRWETETYAQNPNANALRWGTLYNFRFDSDLPPGAANLTLELFKPGDDPLVAAGLIAPSACPADLNADGQIDLVDLSVQLAHFGSPTPATVLDGDLNGDGAVDLTDVSVLLAGFGQSCP